MGLSGTTCGIRWDSNVIENGISNVTTDDFSCRMIVLRTIFFQISDESKAHNLNFRRE